MTDPLVREALGTILEDLEQAVSTVLTSAFPRVSWVVTRDVKEPCLHIHPVAVEGVALYPNIVNAGKVVFRAPAEKLAYLEKAGLLRP